MGGIDPAFARVIRQREAEKRSVVRYVREGIITAEQGETILERLDGHRTMEEFESAKELWPCNVAVLTSWLRLGEPVSIVAGMAVGLLDNRANLYRSRIAWLDENGLSHPDARAYYLGAWSDLDTRKRSIEIERLNNSGD